MELLRRLVTLCLITGAASMAMAADAPKDLVLKGDAACTACHDEADGPELLAIGKTKHGTRADSRTPSCTSCHGDSKPHLDFKGSGKRPPPDVAFGYKVLSTAEARAGACQDCHRKDSKRSHWEGSAHQAAEVACSSCHKVHVAKDAVRDKRTQADTCFACHKEQRAQANKPSHHPLVEGKMTCSDCHNAHGSAGPSALVRNSVVETCYSCHMEKRGPFVFGHQPVNEDCSTCHNAHGTTAESLLKARAPFLCHSCHNGHGPVQPSLANTTPLGAAPGWWNGSAVTQGKSCMSCHSQIHGSNNPGSAAPSPQRLFR